MIQNAPYFALTGYLNLLFLLNYQLLELKSYFLTIYIYLLIHPKDKVPNSYWQTVENKNNYVTYDSR